MRRFLLPISCVDSLEMQRQATTTAATSIRFFQPIWNPYKQHNNTQCVAFFILFFFIDNVCPTEYKFGV